MRCGRLEISLGALPTLVPGIAVFAGSFLLIGCSFTDQTVRLPSPKITPTLHSPAPGAVVVVPLIIDLREAVHYIGVKKNLFGTVTAKVFPDRNAPLWLREQLMTQLKAAGVKTVAKAADESAVLVQLFLKRMLSEPRWSWGAGDIATTLVVRLKVSSPTGETADRTYEVTGLASGEVPSEKNYTPSLERAAAELMKLLMPDILSMTSLSTQR